MMHHMDIEWFDASQEHHETHKTNVDSKNIEYVLINAVNAIEELGGKYHQCTLMPVVTSTFTWATSRDKE